MVPLQAHGPVAVVTAPILTPLTLIALPVGAPTLISDVLGKVITGIPLMEAGNAIGIALEPPARLYPPMLNGSVK